MMSDANKMREAAAQMAERLNNVPRSEVLKLAQQIRAIPIPAPQPDPRDDEVVEAMSRAGCDAANEAYDTGGNPTRETSVTAGKAFMRAALAVARQHIAPAPDPRRSADEIRAELERLRAEPDRFGFTAIRIATLEWALSATQEHGK